MKTQSMVGATGDLCRGLRRLSLVLACTVAAAACSVSSLRDEAGGESETIKGDWAAATPLFEKAYAAHPDVTNQFNLATAYQNTGQTAKAIQLYEAVVLDGQFTITTPITAPGVAADPLTASVRRGDAAVGADGQPPGSARRNRPLGPQPGPVFGKRADLRLQGAGLRPPRPDRRLSR
jgi:hypothetical protein